MLEINNLSVSLIKDDRPLFTNLSLTINKGEKVALISEEGNGKSTLLKLINGETMEHLLVKGQIKTHQLLLGYLPQTLEKTRAQCDGILQRVITRSLSRLRVFSGSLTTLWLYQKTS